MRARNPSDVAPKERTKGSSVGRFQYCDFPFSTQKPPILGRDVNPYVLAEWVRAFIDTNLSERVKLDDLALQTGCTTFQIIKAFRRAIGATPHAFQIETRIKR